MTQSIQFQMFPDYLADGIWATPHDCTRDTMTDLREAGAQDTTLQKITEWVSQWELWNIDMDPEFWPQEFDAQWVENEYTTWYQQGASLCNQLNLETGFDIQYTADTPDAIKSGLNLQVKEDGLEINPDEDHKNIF